MDGWMSISIDGEGGQWGRETKTACTVSSAAVALDVWQCSTVVWRKTSFQCSWLVLGYINTVSVWKT